MYQEEDDSTVTHNGKEYAVNDLLRRAAKLPEVDVPLMWVEWCASPDKTKTDRERTARADITAPILFTIDPEYGHVVLDGAHRVSRAIQLKRKTIPGKEIPSSWL